MVVIGEGSRRWERLGWQSSQVEVCQSLETFLRVYRENFTNEGPQRIGAVVAEPLLLSGVVSSGCIVFVTSLFDAANNSECSLSFYSQNNLSRFTDHCEVGMVSAEA